MIRFEVRAKLERERSSGDVGRRREATSWYRKKFGIVATMVEKADMRM